jgi:AraC family transcriptional regulator, exoenzyme S synthesis regulatory protein ExsA
MKTINLPDALDIDTSASIQLFVYESTQEISKQQIVLNRNTFSFLQEGTKEVYFDNSSFSIDNSQFLLMKSGHCLMTEKLSKAQDQYKSILFFFTNEAVEKFIRKYDLPLINSTNHFSTYSFQYDSFINSFTKSLIEIADFSKSIQGKILNSKFEEIMLYLVEFNGVDFLYSIITNLDDQEQKFRQTIEKNKLNKLTISELSFICNMSVSTFKREFQKHFFSTPSKWFQEKRLEHAAYLLKNNNYRASDIYEEIGYENLSNFIQAFKSKFGVTPKQYASI